MERVTAACVAAANAQGMTRGMQWTAVTAVIDTPGAPQNLRVSCDGPKHEGSVA
jgi:hypothetical protein